MNYTAKTLLIKCDALLFENIKEDLISNFKNMGVKPKISMEKGIDPQVLIAIVSASGMVLGAIVSSILSYLGNKKANKIILQGRSGWRVEVSSEFKKQRIDELIHQVKDKTDDLEEIILKK